MKTCPSTQPPSASQAAYPQPHCTAVLLQGTPAHLPHLSPSPSGPGFSLYPLRRGLIPPLRGPPSSLCPSSSRVTLQTPAPSSHPSPAYPFPVPTTSHPCAQPLPRSPYSPGPGQPSALSHLSSSLSPESLSPNPILLYFQSLLAPISHDCCPYHLVWISVALTLAPHHSQGPQPSHLCSHLPASALTFPIFRGPISPVPICR